MKKEMFKELELVIGKEKDQEFKFRMYYDCYLQAMKSIVKEIVFRLESEKTDKRHVKNVSDIIAFIGGRGTGKTTAMEAFSDVLKKSQKERNKWLEEMSIPDETKQKILAREIEFSVLPTIDASLLEDKEDLFELILASMFEKYEEQLKDGSFSQRYEWTSTRQEASKKFGEVYRNHRNVKHIEKHEDIGESVISKLRAMPSSLKTQTAFDNLLKAFFSVISSKKEVMNYLVVVIDDLDLNVKHGFEMLEQIHKYLAHPQVIVLATFSYEQLLIITENHFRESLLAMTRGDETVEKQKIATHCRRLARDYLDKMIPTEKRIYMPNIAKSSQETRIKETRIEDKTLHIEEIETKQYVFRKIASLLQVYYDGRGIKRHFSEIDTVRTLMSYLYFLDSLNDINFDKCKMIKGEWIEEYSDKDKDEFIAQQNEFMKDYTQNYERFNRDIRERMLFEKTNVEQQDFIQIVLEMDMSQRAKYLISLVENRLKPQKPAVDIDSARYRYGDLLKCIYSWGRSALSDKHLIHCIIASFTSRMVREYMNYMYSDKESERKKSRSCLEAFIGESFGNGWIGNMLLTRWQDEAQPEKFYDGMGICYVKNLELKLCSLEFPLGTIEELKEQIQTNKSDRCANLVDYIISRLEIEKFVPTLECFRMLLENYSLIDSPRKDLTYRFQIKKVLLEGQEQVSIVCSFEPDMADFDIFGFVKKSIAPLKEHQDHANLTIEDFAISLTAFLIEEVDGQMDKELQDTLQGGLVESLKKQSIFAEEKQIEETIAFPFYNFDLSYNIIKRVRKRCKEEFVRPIAQQEIVGSIVEVYKCIEEELENQEIFYDEKPPKIFVYNQIFSNYPYIKAMKELANHEGFVRSIGRILKSATSIRRAEQEVVE